MTAEVAQLERFAVPLSWLCGLALIIRASKRWPTHRARRMRGWQLVPVLVFASSIVQLWIDDWRPFAGDVLVLAVTAMLATRIVSTYPFPIARVWRRGSPMMMTR